MNCRTTIVASTASMLLLASCVSNIESENANPVRGTVWTQASHAEFSKGKFGDSGANIYVSAKGRIQTINRWDLNDDGEIDLVFANSHMQCEKLDAAIYWGNGKDFSDQRISMIPNEGAQHFCATDLDGDGRMDLVVPNYANGTWTKMPSAVYYGAGGANTGPGEAWNITPFARKISLPTDAAQGAAVADLNRDGFPDIIYAQSAGFWEYRGGNALASPSRIYWGSKSGYSKDNFLDIEASGASDVAIADLNNDQWPDLVIANREKAGRYDVDSFIYLGSVKGFSNDRRITLPTNQVNAVAIADVNGDKKPDILFANGKGPSSYVYLNQDGTFIASSRIEVPTSDSRGCAAADLNGDGTVDLFFTCFQTAGNPLTLSYLYWGDGKGFSAERRQTFETVGASGVSLADLNKDGRIDIVVSNFQEHTSYDVPSYIYWNTEKGFSDAMRTSLFTHGAVGNTIADFNGDGNPDIVFANTMGRRRGGVTNSFVYWGNPKGQYSVKERLDLPAVEPYDWAAGDLNDDGKVDLLFGNMAEVGRRTTESFIYWGGDTPYSPSRRSALLTQGARGIGLADFDHDGYLDVIAFNTSPGQGAAGAAGQAAPPPGTIPDGGVFIYWGSGDGFITTQRSELAGGGSGLPQFADLNGDQHLDVIVPGGLTPTLIYWGDGSRNFSPQRRSAIPQSEGMSNSEIADINRDGQLDLILTFRGSKPSYIYYGNGKGEFSADRRSTFTPLETQGVSIGDLNKDGWLDIVAPAYKDGGSRATQSIIFWGGPEGISDKRVQRLPTNGGTGSVIADFNHDGINDLLLICHRSEGDPNKVGVLSDHCTDSYLYWGGLDGLKEDRKLLIPCEGAHYDCGVDLGNIFDRSFQFDYVSNSHEYGKETGDRIEWKAQTPGGSRVLFQVRTAASESALAAAEWSGPGGKGTYYDQSGASMRTPVGHSWIQYRAVLESRSGANSPIVESVSLSFR
jgi:hypothetical protein